MVENARDEMEQFSIIDLHYKYITDIFIILD